MLSITDILVRISGRFVIDHGSAQIVPGARVGLVGRNGAGKSTLFQAIRGELPTETGTIPTPPRWRVGSLAQEAPNGPESLIEVVLAADLERDALLREADTARDPHRIAEIQTRLVDIGAHSAAAVCWSRLPRPCSPRPTFCSWTSRPTISISRARSGSRTIWRTIRAPS